MNGEIFRISATVELAMRRCATRRRPTWCWKKLALKEAVGRTPYPRKFKGPARAW